VGRRAIAQVTAATVLATLLVLAAVIAVISAPLRRARKPESPDGAERSALEAAREAKYREIKDAELDYATGKLSREDFEPLHDSLRAEALAILDRIAALERRSPNGSAPPQG
jgi:hypothetical protein